jgi:S1-C subfamily serine protease
MSVSSSELKFLQSLSDAIVEVAKKVSPSVVQVSAGRGLGSGVIWTKEGHIITSNHVIGRSEKVQVGSKGGEELDATIVGRDRFSDIAVLKIETEAKVRPMEIGDSNLSVGQFVLALANPFGENVSATSGIITNPRASLGGPWTDHVITTDARLNPGYSGGPLVDASGKMIGLNVGYFSNRGVAIPVNTMLAVAKDLMSKGKISRAYLGIVSQPVDLPQEIAKAIGQDGGLIVLSVDSGTPAKKAGVAIGDIIVKVNSNRVEGYQDLQKALTGELVGKESRLSVLRGEKLTELSITPSEA